MVSDSAAQKLTQRQRRERMDSVLAARYYKIPYDTNYVVRPQGRLTLKVRMNQTGNSIHAKGTVNGLYSKADLSTSHKTTFALAAIYRGIGVGFAVNPAKWKGIYKDYEFNLNYYSNRLSLDLSYQRSESLAGDIKGDRGEQHLLDEDLKMKVLNMVGYYAFNHRRFSFPAAFTQSYIQRRSAGSWLAAVSYQGGSITTTDSLTKRLPGSPSIRMYFGNFGIGGGYGYNWVLGKKWLIHLSVMPTFVVFNRNNLTVNGERQKARPVALNMIFNERVAIIHFISKRYFVGITGVMNNTLFNNDRVTINQNKWRARAFLGMRF